MTLVTLAMTASGCADQPSQQEFDAALASFDAFPDEVKAYVCADDFYAAQYGVEGFVLVERCGSPTAVDVRGRAPLSPEFERAQVEYATQFYADIEGHPDDRSVRLALEELDYFTDHVKLLGVYPAARRHH